MHSMYLNNKEKLSKSKALKFKIIGKTSIVEVIAGIASILASIINAEVAKIEASFLAF